MAKKKSNEMKNIEDKYKKAVFDVFTELVNKHLKLQSENTVRPDRLARELTIQCLRFFPSDMRSSFPLEGNETVTEKEIDDYIKTKNAKNIDVFYKNGQAITLPYFVSWYIANNYLNGTTVIPAFELRCFCKIPSINLTMEEFYSKVEAKLNGSEGKISEKISSNTENSDACPLQCFLKDQFSHARYAFGSDANKMNSLFQTEEERKNQKTTLHYIILPRYSEKHEIHRGVVIFDNTKGYCSVSIELEKNSADDENVTYSGFAIILDPTKANATCWCFLKRDNVYAELTTLNFRLPGSASNATWQTRVAQVLDITSDKYIPIVSRMLLSKEYIKKDDLKYFEGYIKLNPGKIQILSQKIDAVKAHLNGVPYELSNDATAQISKESVEKYFEKYSLNKKIDSNIVKAFDDLVSPLIPESLLTIDNKENIEIFKDYPEILSWLRQHGLPAQTNKVANALDEDVERMYKKLYGE